MCRKFRGLGIAAGWVFLLLAHTADAASNFTTGSFSEYNPAGGVSFHDHGVCAFYAGPRGTLGANRFLMRLGDRHSGSYRELQVTGYLTTIESGSTGNTRYRLFPDELSTVLDFQKVLRGQLDDPSATFTPYSFRVGIADTFGPGSEDRFTCDVSLSGRVSGDRVGDAPVSLTFSGGGHFIAADDRPRPSVASLAALAPKTADPSCSTGKLAPDGLDPLPGNGQCKPGSDCLLDFKGYKWWTSFNFRGEGFENPDGYWNDALHTPFSPKNAFVDAAGLHLRIQKQDLGAPEGAQPAGAEVVVMFKKDGSQANLGYGKYLVTATTKTASTWDDLDLNAAFGAFTFERFGFGAGGGTVNNPNREIDLAEISRWGWPAGDPLCPKTADPPQLCRHNAQFALQNWWENKTLNVHRYPIAAAAKTVTLVMIWPGAGKAVTFKQYNRGGITLKTLPAKADNEWTSTKAQNIFVPGTNCERFHLNLWLGNYRGNPRVHPPPKTMPYEVVVTNFEFAK
jgi:hypothetical protein